MIAAAGGNLWSSLLDVNDYDDDDDDDDGDDDDYDDGSNSITLVSFQGSKLKKIPKSPFGDQLEKYSLQMQIFSRQFV